MKRALTCGNCGGRLPILARADARWCSTRCRVAGHRAARSAKASPAAPAPTSAPSSGTSTSGNRASTLPRELLDRARWVRRSARKVPLAVDGGAASSTDPGTWASHAAASSSRVGAGLGFVLDGDGIVCLDLDHCLVGGVPTAAAAAVLAVLPATYVEVSPSGDGLHVWGRGQLGRGRRVVVAGVALEAYATGRYIAMTGDRFGAAPSVLADLDVAALLARAA